MSKILESGSLEECSIESLLATQDFESEHKSRVDAVGSAVKAISKNYNERHQAIVENSNQYMPEKVQDQQYNLRESTRQTLTELVRAKGFLKEIDAARAELDREAAMTEVQQLTQTMKEIEVRAMLRDIGPDWKLTYAGKILDGDPMFIQAIVHAPIDMGVDQGILADGIERRKAVLKPLLFKRLKGLEEAQATIQGIADILMPIKSGDIDHIRDAAAVTA